MRRRAILAALGTATSLLAGCQALSDPAETTTATTTTETTSPPTTTDAERPDHLDPLLREAGTLWVLNRSEFDQNLSVSIGEYDNDLAVKAGARTLTLEIPPQTTKRRELVTEHGAYTIHIRHLDQRIVIDKLSVEIATEAVRGPLNGECLSVVLTESGISAVYIINEDDYSATH